MDDATALPATPPAHANIRGLRCNTLLGEAGWPSILSYIEQNERTIVSSLTCAGLLSAANSVRRTAAFGPDQFVIGGVLSLERLVRARARFPALCVHTLCFDDCNATDVFVSAVARQCCEVESVDLTLCALITDASIGALAESCPRLKIVNLGGCVRITDVSLVALAGSCPLLESVDLYWCELLTDVSIVALAGNCPLLKSVNLDGCELITDASVAALRAALPGVSLSMEW